MPGQFSYPLFLVYVGVLIEGTVSGLAYVNTFNLTRHNVRASVRDVVMGVAVCATTAGPIVAALLGIFLERRFDSVEIEGVATSPT